jgi:hypothetical protein
MNNPDLIAIDHVMSGAQRWGRKRGKFKVCKGITTGVTY